MERRNGKRQKVRVLKNTDKNQKSSEALKAAPDTNSFIFEVARTRNIFLTRYFAKLRIFKDMVSDRVEFRTYGRAAYKFLFIEYIVAPYDSPWS